MDFDPNPNKKTGITLPKSSASIRSVDSKEVKGIPHLPAFFKSQVPSLLNLAANGLIMEHGGEVNVAKMLAKDAKEDVDTRLKAILLPQLTERLLLHVVRGEQKEAEAMIKVNPDLLLETDRVESYAKDLDGNPVIVEGTAFQLALGAEDDDMALMIAKYLDEHHFGEKQKQYQAQFPNEEKEDKAEDFSQTADGKALQTIIDAISKADARACERVLNHEEKLAPDDKESQTLLAVLNAFREYLAPKKDPQTNETIPIKTGKHFNMQLLIEAFKLYDQNYKTFGGYYSYENDLCWQKVIGYMERFLPACYAQAFAQGIDYIVGYGEKLRHSFNFRFGSGFYFPLDADPNFRLGYRYGCASVGRLLWSCEPAPLWENYVKQKQQRCKELCNTLAISLKASI